MYSIPLSYIVKNTFSIVTCDMSRYFNMSQFEKFANFGMTCGVKKSNIGYIFDARKNPRMMSGKITFLRDSCKVFAPTSKTKRLFDFLTPPYYYDICYFHIVDIHHIIIKTTLRRKIKGFIYILSSSCLAPFGRSKETLLL